MILRHRDRELLRFEWDGLEGVRVVSVNDAERRFLPLEMKGDASDASLWKWLSNRIVPKHRNYIQDTLVRLGLEYNVRSITEVSGSLSLNDVYWVCGDNSKRQWSNVNLYDNPFSEAISVLAFSGDAHHIGSGLKDLGTSPEFTTNGMLAKCWHRRDDGIFLYKSGTEHFANAGFEPYSEFYASQIAEALSIRHVPYDLEMFKGRLCSTCPLFTSDRYGFVPAGRILNTREALADVRFSDIFFLDALILNTDRHLGNFGYVIDNDTNEIVDAAPVFDNGYGLFSLALDKPSDPVHHEFDDLRRYIRKIGPSLYTFWCGFPSGITTAMQSRAMLLANFRFRRHSYYNLPEARLEKIEYFIRKRAAEIAEFGAKSDEFLLIDTKSDRINFADSPADDRINGNNGDSLIIQIKENIRIDPFVTTSDLAQILGVSEATINRKIAVLRKSGELVRVGSRKTGSWKIVNPTMA